jgi:hypothetical protein
MQPSAATPKQVILAHKKRSAEDLFATISPALSQKPLVHLNALLEQTDTFSCVYRSLFHAQCITMALHKASQGDSFESNLKLRLQDEQSLNLAFCDIKSYLDRYDPTFDRTTGLQITHLLGICAASIPVLHAQVLPIILKSDNKIYAVNDPTPCLPSPLYYSTDFIRRYPRDEFPASCLVELDNSAQLRHQLAQLREPRRVAHFACNFPQHLFIGSIITDAKGYAKLYVIDSNNNNVSTHPLFFAFTSKLLEYAEQHNAKLSHQLRKKERHLRQIALAGNSQITG